MNKLLTLSATLLITLFLSSAFAQNLDMWTWYTSQAPAMEDAIGQCNEETGAAVTSQVYPIGEYPQVLRTAVVGGTGPDIFGAEPDASEKGIITYADAERVTGLGAYYEEYGWSERLNPAAVEQVTIDGTPYSVPLDVNALGVFYNKSIFEELGLEVPTTWANFEQVSQTLTDEGLFPVALGNQNRWTGMDWFFTLAGQAGGPTALSEADSGERPWTDEVFVQALERLQALNAQVFNRGVNAIDDSAASQLFFNERAAMWYTGSWALPNIEQNAPEGLEVGVFLLPAAQSGWTQIVLGGVGMNVAVSASSENQDAAASWLDCFMGDDAQRSFVRESQFISTNPSANSELSNPMAQSFATFIEEGPLAPRVLTGNPEIYNALASGIQELLEGSAEPMDVLEAATAAQAQ